MVWACQDAPEDTATGVDSVKIKPLKKRCSARAGLSRFYSSKSQSFSSIDLVHCTPFGNSALALAKRPSSFDLRRGSPRRNGLGFSKPVRIRKGGDSSYLSASTEEDDEAVTERCPCNDTIFTDPTDAFISPEGSPRASPTHNMYDSLSQTCTTLPYMASCQQQVQQQVYLSQQQQQQQQQYQLSGEYLSQLSLLLPMQYGYFSNPSAGGLSETNLSSYCSSGSACSSNCRTGSSSFFSGDSAATCCSSSALCRNSCPASWLRHSQSCQPQTLSMTCAAGRLSSDNTASLMCQQQSNSRVTSSCGGVSTVAARPHGIPAAAALLNPADAACNAADAAAGSNGLTLSAVQVTSSIRIGGCRSRAWTSPSAVSGSSGGILSSCPSQGPTTLTAMSGVGVGNLPPERVAATLPAFPTVAACFPSAAATGVAAAASSSPAGSVLCGSDGGGVTGVQCTRPYKLSRHSARGRLGDSGLASEAAAAPSLWDSPEQLLAALSLRDEDRRLPQQYAFMG